MLPVKTRHPIESSRSNAFDACNKSSNKASHKAFNALGRFKVNKPTLSRFSTKMCSYESLSVDRVRVRDVALLAATATCCVQRPKAKREVISKDMLVMRVDIKKGKTLKINWISARNERVRDGVKSRRSHQAKKMMVEGCQKKILGW